MSLRPVRLTTTSYALLGLLAVRPFSAYELTQQMRRSLHYVWPKSESLLYTEPKKLVAAGLARVAERRNGQRSSALYRITPAGRRAFAEWLDTPPAPPTLEFETMLRVTFADQGTTAQLAGALRAASEWAAAELREARPQLADYVDAGGPFPQRLHLIALVAGFYAELFDLVRRFGDDAATLVEQWPSTTDVFLGPELLGMLRRALDAAERCDDAGSR